MCLLIPELTGCFHVCHLGANLSHPDRILFDRAMLAVQEKRFDVAHLTFQTLINTYPDSKYARRAKKFMMRDSQIGGCGPTWSTPPCTDYSRGVPR